MSEDNKAVSRRFHEAIAKGSTHALQAEFAPNYVAHFPGIPVPLDAQGFNQLVNVFASGFPESHFDLDDVFEAGDKVVTRWTYRAVHSGEFQGIPPTGKQVAMTGITILRLAGGKISREHGRTQPVRPAATTRRCSPTAGAGRLIHWQEKGAAG